MGSDSFTKTVYIAPPDCRSLRRLLRGTSGQAFSWAYFGQAIHEFHQSERSFQHQGNQIDIARQFHEAGETLREPFLAYLYDIGRDLQSLRWWVSSLSFRNIHTSKTFHQACYLKVALDLARSCESQVPLVLVVSDRPVRSALEQNLSQYREMELKVLGRRTQVPLQPILDTFNMLFHRTVFLLRQTGRLLISRWLIPRPYVAADRTTLIVSYATPSNAAQGQKFHESYFGDLAQQIKDSGNSVAVMPMIIREARYKETLQGIRRGPFPLVVPERYLSFMDLVRTAAISCAAHPKPRRISKICGLDITPLMEDEFRSHWISNNGAQALLMVALVRRWARLGFSLSRMIYIYENQPWERALCWESRRSLPEATIIGYQHAGLARLLLKFFLAPGEHSEAPLPDRVVAVGKYSARLLTINGHQPERVRVGGALQVQGLLNRRPKNPEPNGIPPVNTVLVATSIGLEESAELIDMAVRLFDGDEGIRVILKCHPLISPRLVSQLTGPKLPGHVQVSEEPIADLMLQSSVMVYSASTVCVQALALGLPVIHLSTKFDFDLDPLEAAPGARLEAAGLEDLREKVRWLLAHREEYRARHEEEWQNLVQDFYGPVTEETVRAFID